MSSSSWFRYLLCRTPQQALEEALGRAVISKTFFRFNRRSTGCSSINNKDDVQAALSLLRICPWLASVKLVIDNGGTLVHPLVFFLVARAPFQIIKEVYSMYPDAIEEAEEYRYELPLHVACRHYSAVLVEGDHDGKDVIQFLAKEYPKAAGHRGRSSGYPLDICLYNMADFCAQSAEEMIRFLVELYPGALNRISYKRNGDRILSPVDSPLYKVWRRNFPSTELLAFMADHTDEALMDEFQVEGGGTVTDWDGSRPSVMETVILPRFKTVYFSRSADEGLLHRLLKGLVQQQGNCRVESLHIELSHDMLRRMNESICGFLRENTKIRSLRLAIRENDATTSHQPSAILLDGKLLPTNTTTTTADSNVVQMQDIRIPLMIDSNDLERRRTCAIFVNCLTYLTTKPRTTTTLQQVTLEGLTLSDVTFRKLMSLSSFSTGITLDKCSLMGKDWPDNLKMVAAQHRLKCVTVTDCYSVPMGLSFYTLLKDIARLPHLEELKVCPPQYQQSFSKRWDRDRVKHWNITEPLVNLLRSRAPLRKLAVFQEFSLDMGLLLEALRHNKTLEVLDLAWAKLLPEHVDQACEILTNDNVTLQDLNCRQSKEYQPASTSTPCFAMMRYLLLLNKYGRGKLRQNDGITKAEAVDCLCSVGEGLRHEYIPMNTRLDALFDLLRESPPHVWCS